MEEEKNQTNSQQEIKKQICCLNIRQNMYRYIPAIILLNKFSLLSRDDRQRIIDSKLSTDPRSLKLKIPIINQACKLSEYDYLVRFSNSIILEINNENEFCALIYIVNMCYELAQNHRIHLIVEMQSYNRFRTTLYCLRDFEFESIDISDKYRYD